MGTAQTYETTKEQLSDAYIGVGKKFEETFYYFLDENHGFYYLTEDDYDIFNGNSSILSTKSSNINIKVVCDYSRIIWADFNDQEKEVCVNHVVSYLSYQSITNHEILHTVIHILLSSFRLRYTWPPNTFIWYVLWRNLSLLNTMHLGYSYQFNSLATASSCI